MILESYFRCSVKVEVDVQETKVIVPFVDVTHLIVLVEPFVRILPSFTTESCGFVKAVGH